MSVETFWQSKFFVNRKTRAMSSRHFTRTWRISLIFSTRHKQIWTNERSKFFGQVVLFLIHNKCIGVLTCMVHVWMFVTPCIVPWMNKYVIEFFCRRSSMLSAINTNRTWHPSRRFLLLCTHLKWCRMGTSMETLTSEEKLPHILLASESLSLGAARWKESFIFWILRNHVEGSSATELRDSEQIFYL